MSGFDPAFPVYGQMDPTAALGKSKGGGAPAGGPTRRASHHTEFKPTFYNPNEVKHRQRTTRKQFRALEDVFLRDSKPSAAERRELGERLNMSARSVQVWFQNRRAKEKNRLAALAKKQTQTPSEGTADSTASPAPMPRQPTETSVSPKLPPAVANSPDQPPPSTSAHLHQLDFSRPLSDSMCPGSQQQGTTIANATNLGASGTLSRRSSYAGAISYLDALAQPAAPTLVHRSPSAAHLASSQPSQAPRADAQQHAFATFHPHMLHFPSGMANLSSFATSTHPESNPLFISVSAPQGNTFGLPNSSSNPHQTHSPFLPVTAAMSYSPVFYDAMQPLLDTRSRANSIAVVQQPNSTPATVGTSSVEQLQAAPLAATSNTNALPSAEPRLSSQPVFSLSAPSGPTPLNSLTLGANQVAPPPSVSAGSSRPGLMPAGSGEGSGIPQRLATIAEDDTEQALRTMLEGQFANPPSNPQSTHPPSLTNQTALTLNMPRVAPEEQTNADLQRPMDQPPQTCAATSLPQSLGQPISELRSPTQNAILNYHMSALSTTSPTAPWGGPIASQLATTPVVGMHPFHQYLHCFPAAEAASGVNIATSSDGGSLNACSSNASPNSTDAAALLPANTNQPRLALHRVQSTGSQMASTASSGPPAGQGINAHSLPSPLRSASQAMPVSNPMAFAPTTPMMGGLPRRHSMFPLTTSGTSTANGQMSPMVHSALSNPNPMELQANTSFSAAVHGSPHGQLAYSSALYPFQPMSTGLMSHPFAMTPAQFQGHGLHLGHFTVPTTPVEHHAGFMASQMPPTSGTGNVTTAANSFPGSASLSDPSQGEQGPLNVSYFG
ncbi:hypothetical protein H4R34_000595 [Dimargaris verticillata]|uniref:Homeobox domain-containing protein n=1 Tax=Dimargaris verticillata TaxID=2761393 RepID=A0A9W8B509_9FUNG|nr:hypothetical protein H4R34_000595 [Dimargaris verticillata]